LFLVFAGVLVVIKIFWSVSVTRSF